jgi:hypothetical protein
MAFNPSLYQQARPDLLNNWNWANNPSSVPADVRAQLDAQGAWLRDWILSHGSLQGLLQADYNANPTAGEQVQAQVAQAQPAAATPPPATVTPPPVVTTPPPTPAATTPPPTTTVTPPPTSTTGLANPPPATTTTTTPPPAQQSYAQLLAQWKAENPTAALTGDAFNAWAASKGISSWTNSTPTEVSAALGLASTTGTPVATGTTDGGVHARNLEGEGQNTLAAQIGLAGPAYDAYAKYSGQYAQTDLNNLRNSLYGSVDAGQFLQAHPEFKQGYDNARATGQDPQAWLNTAVNNSTYIDQAAVPRGGGLLSINDAVTQQANQQTVRGNTALRTGNVADAANLGPEALAAFQSLNPQLYSSLNRASAAAGTGVQVNQYEAQLAQQFAQGNQPQANPFLSWARDTTNNQGGTALSGDLTTMARQQLALGSGLSDEQKRNAEQAAREAYAARGLVYSPGAVGAEILNKDAYGQQLLGQRQNFATGVNTQLLSGQSLGNQMGLGLLSAGNTEANRAMQSQQQNQSLGLGLAGMDYSRQQQNIGNLFTDVGAQSSNAFNPFSTITSAGTSNQGSNPGLFSSGAGVSSGATGNQNVQSMFNPFNSYSSDLYNTNYNAIEAAKIAAANNSAAKTGSIIGGVGQIAGAAASAKIFMACIPEGQKIDTPEGAKNIEDIRSGDTVIGYAGDLVTVMQKHEYAENPEGYRFLRFQLSSGEAISVCDKHRIEGLPSENFNAGDFMGNYQIENIVRYDGVSRSFDLLTSDAGYRMAGVPVNSMIEEMTFKTAQLMEAS